MTLRGSQRGFRPPLLCWHGASNQLPVKLSVRPWRYADLSPVKNPQVTPLVLLLKNTMFTCFKARGWGKRGGNKGEGGGREIYVACNVANPILKAVDHHLFCFPKQNLAPLAVYHRALKNKIPQYEVITLSLSCTLTDHMSLSV